MKIAATTFGDLAMRHGGTIRTLSLLEAIEAAGADVQVIHGKARGWVDHAPQAGPFKADRARTIKRRYLPMPSLLAGHERELRAQLAASDADVLLPAALSHAPVGRGSPAALWLDLKDLWSTFALRESTARHGLSRATSRAQAGLLRSHEKRYARRAALTTTCGWLDHVSLLKRGLQNTWVPAALPDVEFKQRIRSDSTHVAGLLGSFHYHPNVAAYHTLVQNWLPALVRQGWTLLVAGHGSTNLPPVNGVRLLGTVSKPDDFYADIDILLFPVTFGGGMKVKIIEALSRGVPVVTTVEGREGLHPGVHSMLTVLDADSTELPDLDQLVVPDPSTSDALGLYRQSRVNRTVDQLLRDEFRPNP